MYHTQMCATQERLFAITHLYGGLAFPSAQVLLGISGWEFQLLWRGRPEIHP